ncbi:ATP-grasp domain-containing protein, partial [Clostridium saudiense]|nr:ATP-grasp domain-containing protein [Clostridium saudiense]
LIMENKVVTKKVLEDNNIKVPKGEEYSSLEEAIGKSSKFVGKPIVIKPKSTNFGIGVSIFTEGASKDDMLKAFEIAFENDKTVLIEEFIKGKEYRFLVVGDQVLGILHRVPANVVGDGISTISELVNLKNEDPLRGKGYKTPLENIILDKNAELFLKQRGIDFNYIPRVDEIVYLRENSNISTGGDSIDYTDDIPQRFKDIAVKATKAVEAKICGVDMMIEDYKDKDSSYAIIELNFNPAIHIHSYPYKGKERNIAVEILKLLDLIDLGDTHK